MHGFPNLFWLFVSGCRFYNPLLLAEYQWTALNNEITNMTLFSKGKNYYVSDNIPGKPRVSTVFLGGFPLYVEHSDKAVHTHADFVTNATAFPA